ncbi:MAG: protein kinase, partial [Deltaproteobacteria bacterium]|nr:protein kinase [Deltaproteobacteria bacterium]
IHRDLKPGNIMLGDFGEVYVLDWGVARIVGVDDITADGDSADSAERMTQPGAILGTPAYMAPEQRRGALDVGPAADVYSLGCILFEILAGEPLAPTPDARAMPVEPLDPRPSARGVDVAPELEAACVAAIAADPAARPSARALSDRLQHYLDGDRDAEQRRALAADHVRAATQALAGDGPDADRRAAAMRRAGQALALDPTSTAAAQIVSRLVLEPPPIAPREVTQLLADRDRETITRQGYLAARSLGTSAVIVALLMWLFVRSWPLTLAVFAVFAASAAHAYRTSRANRTFRPLDIAYILGSNVVILVLLSRLFGVYLIVPAIATAAMSGLAVLPPLLGAYNRVWLAFAAGLVIPAVLETAGVWARTTTFAANGVVIAPLGTEVPAGAELLVLAAVLALLYAAGRYVRDLATANRAAQARLELQAWHLRQLIPPAA